MNPERDLVPTEPFGLIAWLKETRVSLPLKGVECRFEATGPLLHVEIDQIFHQEHAEALDCLYSFPLPAGAAVYRCEMHVNERVISARIEEREKARQIYREQKAAGHRAALVESERENLFTLSLGNLQPGDLIVVRLAYAQVLERLGAELRARIPVCPGVRYIPGKPLLRNLSGRGSVDDTDQVPDASRITPPRMAALHPDSAYFAVSGKVAAPDVADGTLSSPTHPLLTRREGNLEHVELADRGAVPDRDLVVRWEEPAAASLCSHGWEFRSGKESFALLSLRSPDQVQVAADFTQDFYFLVDRSGSMEGAKWQQTCAALHEFVKLVGADDRVWLTLFGTEFQDFADAPISATELRADRGFLQIARLGVGGGTELLPAVTHVLRAMKKHSKGRRAVVILLTDGQVGNESEVVRAFAAGCPAAVHTVGIDTAVNDAFLRELARKTGGECWLLTPDDDVAGTVARLGHRLSRPALSELAVTGDFEPARSHLPDLFAGQAAEISLRGAPKHGALAITGRVAGGAALTLSPDLAASGNPALRLIWGRDHIEALLDAGKDKAAIALAKEFNLLCRGVAFIAWDEAEKVVIAEREIYQPNVEISMLCCAPMPAPKYLKMRSALFNDLDSDTTTHRYMESAIGEPMISSLHEPRQAWLGGTTEFFASHKPSWMTANLESEAAPLVPVFEGVDLSTWIKAVLLTRRTSVELAEFLVAWLQAEFGVEVDAGPVMDTEFVAWVLAGADPRLNNPGFARLTRDLLASRPPAVDSELRKLRRMLDKWIAEGTRVDADPPRI